MAHRARGRTDRVRPPGGRAEHADHARRGDGARPARVRPAWLTSVRRRPAGAVSLVLLSALAVLVSVLAPLLLRAVEQVGLAEATGRSHLDDTAVVSIADVEPGRMLVAASDVRSVVQSVNSAHDAGGASLWRAPVTAAESGGDTTWVSPADPDVTGSARVAGLYGNDCGDVVPVDGRCPAAAAEVMVPSTIEGVATGDLLDLDTGSSVVEATVVGRYDPRQGDGRFFAAPSRAVSVDVPTTDDLVVSSDGFDALLLTSKAYGALVLSGPLALDDVDTALTDVATARESALGTAGAESDVELRTGLPGVLDRVGRQGDAATVLAAVTALQALALAWFVVALVVQRLARVRSAEWGLARLRGATRGRWLAVVFTEPVLAVVVGGVAGGSAGWAIAAAVVRSALGPSVPVEPTHPVVVASAALALVGSVVALVAASVRSAVVPLDQLLARTAEPRRLGRLAVVVQSGLALVTVTVLVAAVTQGEVTGPGLALLAPGLVAVLVGVVALRVAALAVGRSTRRPPRSLSSLLVARRLGRTPSVLTAAVLVCVGVALASWSTQVAVTADRLQVDRARASVGASTALTVNVPSDVPFVDAVRAADPDGRRAMAADVYTRGQGVGRLVAVDASRLGAVSSWSPAWSDLGDADRLARALAPRGGEALTLTGTSVSIDLADVATTVPEGFSAEDFTTDLADVSVRLVVQADDGWHTVDLGEPRDGTLTSVPGRFPCADGCRVVWFGATSSRATTPPFGLRLTVTSLSTDRQPADELAGWVSADRWRDRIGDGVDPQRPARATLADLSDGRGLALVLIDEQGAGTASIAPLDTPEPIPALVARGTPVTPLAGVRDGIVGLGPDLSERALARVGAARVLPRVGGEGVLVDLGVLDRVTDPARSEASHEVWLAPMSAAEEARVVDDLSRRGVEVVASRSLATVADGYRRSETTRASSATLVVAAAALLLTLAATAALRAVSATGRREDRRALATAGITPGRLRRVALLEAFLPPAAGVVLGVGAGLLAYLLTVPGLPLVVGAGRTPPPDLAPSAWPLLALGVGTLALLAGIVGVATRLEARAADRTVGPR